jgi:hypothetical protein
MNLNGENEENEANEVNEVPVSMRCLHVQVSNKNDKFELISIVIHKFKRFLRVGRRN